MVPRTIGLAVTQANLWVITILASMTSEGGISIFNLSNNIQSLPIGIFGIAFAISSFPFLAEAYSKNNVKKYKDYFSSTFCKILFFVIPASILILLERAQIVRLILGAGKFDWEDTYLTAQSLGYFSIGIFAQALVPLVARAFYSIQDTKTPVIVSVISVLVNIVASLTLIRSMDILGLALAFSICSFINILLLLIFLRIKVGDLNDSKIFVCSIKIVAISLVMGGVVYILLNIVSSLVDMRTFWGIFIQASLATIGGIIVFISLAYLLKMKEVRDIKEIFGLRN
jgi:putative peptidoglycan lipid II flippase